LAGCFAVLQFRDKAARGVGCHGQLTLCQSLRLSLLPDDSAYLLNGHGLSFLPIGIKMTYSIMNASEYYRSV
jgi:hypothetical protein